MPLTSLTLLKKDFLTSKLPKTLYEMVFMSKWGTLSKCGTCRNGVHVLHLVQGFGLLTV